MAAAFLQLEPESLTFEDVRFRQSYTQTVTVTNNLAATTEFSIRPGSAERYSVSPASLRLQPGESGRVAITLRVLRFARTRKSDEHGQRDIFHIKSAFFDQKFYATFHFAGDAGDGDNIASSSQGRTPGRAGSSSPMSKHRGARGARSATSSPSRPQRPVKALEDSRSSAASEGEFSFAAEGAAQRDLEALQDTVQQQADALVAASAHIRTLEAKLAAAEAGRDTELQAIEQPRAAAGEGEVQELHAALMEREREACGLGVQLEAAMRLADELQARHPDVKRAVGEALAGERAAQEVRNRKVLELLGQKDESIQLMEARYASLEADAAGLKEQLASLEAELRARETHIRDLETEREAMLERVGQASHARESETAVLQARVAELEQALAGAPRSAASLAEELAKVCAERDSAQTACKRAERDAAYRRAQVEALEARTSTLTAQVEALTAGSTDEFMPSVVTAHDAEMLVLRKQLEELERELLAREEAEVEAMVPAGDANRVLADKVERLEAANQQMEAALLEVGGGSASPGRLGSAPVQPETMQELLMEREHQLGELAARLALAEGSADGALRDAEASEAEQRRELAVVRAQLGQREASLAAAHERLAEVESMQLATPAPHPGSARAVSPRQRQSWEGDRTPTAVIEAAPAAPADAAELKAARATAARLSARVSEVTLQEQQARAEAEALRAEVRAVREQHLRDLEEFEHRQQQMRSAVEGISSRQSPGGKPPLPTSSPGGQRNAAASAGQEEGLRQAAADAEEAAESMRLQLAEAREQQQHALMQLEEVQAASTATISQLQRELSERQEGGLQLLPSAEREDNEDRVARLEANLSSLRAAEAEARAGRVLLEEERDRLRQRLREYESRGEAESSGDGGDNLVRQLADRAEAAEAALEQLRAKVSKLEVSGSGTPSPLPAKRRHEDSDVPSTKAALGSRLSAAEAARVEAQAEVAGLRAQLSDSEREVAAAQARLGEVEREAHDANEAAARREMAAAAKLASHTSELSAQAAEAQRSAQANKAAKAWAEERLAAAEAELSRLRSEAESTEREFRMMRDLHSRSIAEKAAECDATRAAQQRAEAEAAERHAQIAVLMDTIETLQAGNPGEREQRVVSLTAQLVSARTQDASREKRAQELVASAEARADEAAGLRRELEMAQEEARRQAAEIGRLKQAIQAKEKDSSSLQERLREAEQQTAAATEQHDTMKEALRQCEAELEGSREALSSANARHVEQLAKERADMAMSLREVKAAHLRSALGDQQQHSSPNFSPDVSPSLLRGLQQLLAWVQQHRSQATAGPGSETDPVVDVMERMQGLVVNAERGRSGAETDKRIATGELLALRSRLRALEAAFESRTSEWETAVAARAAAERLTHRELQQRSRQATARAQLHEQHVQALQRELKDMCSQLAALEAERNAAVAEALKLRHEATTLRRREAAAQSDAKDAAAAAQTAALASEGALAQRDSAIHAYVEKTVVRLLKDRPGESEDTVLSLTRELCALKVVESQLGMQLEAARLHASSLAASNGSLRRAAASAEEQVAQLSEELSTRLEERLKSGGNGAAAEAVGRAEAAADRVRLEARLADCQDALSAAEEEVREAKAAEAAVRSRAVSSEEERRAGLDRLREALATEHAKEMEAVQSQHRRTTQQQASALQELRQEVHELQEAHAAELERAVAKAVAGQPGEEDLADETARRSAAEQRAARLQRELHAANAAVEELQRELATRETELSEAREAQETQTAAIEDLEASFNRLERSAEARQSSGAGGRGRSPSTTPCGTRASSPSVSRELVHVRLAEADLQRKLKVSAREALGLRQQLNARNARVSELKDALEAKNRTIAELRRKLEARGSGAATTSSRGGGNSAAKGRSPGSASTRVSVTPPSSRKKTSSKIELSAQPSREEADPKWAVELGDVWGLEPEGSELYAELSSRGEPADQRALSQLRMELARREATIQRLEAKLLEAISAPEQESPAPTPPAPLRRVAEPASEETGTAEREELRALRREMATALGVAAAILELHQPAGGGSSAAQSSGERTSSGAKPLRRPPATIQLAINELALRLQELEADAAAARSTLAASQAAAARAAAAPPGASMEASQRTVIRSLSSRCGAASAHAAALRAERDRLAGRLAVLRASIGEAGGLPPGLEHLLIEAEAAADDHVDHAPPRHRSTQPATQDGSHRASALGMLELLRHSMMAVQAALESGVGGAVDSARSELTAMAATLEVLWSEVEVLVETPAEVSKDASAADVASARSELAQLRQQAAAMAAEDNAALQRWRGDVEAAAAREAALRAELSDAQGKQAQVQAQVGALQRRVDELSEPGDQLEATLSPDTQSPAARNREEVPTFAGFSVPPSSPRAQIVRHAAAQTSPGSPTAALTSWPPSPQPTPSKQAEDGDSAEDHAVLRARKDKWKQRCEDLRAELSLVRAEAAAAEAALQERLAAADERVRGSSKKASSEAARLRDKLKSTQQRLDTTEELFHEAREAAARHEQRAIESERSVSRLQDRVSLLEASARGRERALESIPPELQSPEESASWRTPPSSTPQRSPLKLRQSGGAVSAEGARVAALQVEIKATLARASQAEGRADEAERELTGAKQKLASLRASAKEEAGKLRSEAEHERSERAKLMVAMTEALAGGKEGAAREAKMRKQVAKLERQVEAAEANEAAGMALAAERLQELEAARAEVASTKVALEEAQQHSNEAIAQRDTRIAELAASLRELEERASEGSAALDELHAKFSGQLTAALTSVEEQLREGPVARMESAVDGVTGELRGLSARCKEMEERVEVLAMERRGLEDEKAAMSLLNQELLENSRLLAERTEAEVQDIRETEGRKAVDAEAAMAEAMKRAEAAEAQIEELRTKLQASQTIGEEERQSLVAHSLEELKAMEARFAREKEIAAACLAREREGHEAEVTALRAEMQGAVDAAVAEAEADVAQRSAAEMDARLAQWQAEWQAESDDLAAGRQAAEQAAEVAKEALRTVQAEFEAYRRQKASEVAALDSRLRALLTSSAAEAAEQAESEGEEGGEAADEEEEEEAVGGVGLAGSGRAPARRRPEVWRPTGLPAGSGAGGGRKKGGKKRSGAKGNNKGKGARLPVLRVPQRVVIPSDLSDASGSSDRTDALLADAARQTQRFQRIIQLRASPAPRAEEAAPEQPQQQQQDPPPAGDRPPAEGPTDATAAAISALREQEARAAVARQVELERLEQKALVGKLQRVISGLNKVIGKMRKKVQSHRAAARVKERQVLAQLSAQQAQLAEMHPGEEVRGLEARLAEAQTAHKSAKADIARLKQHVKALQASAKSDTMPKLSAELTAERTARETAESNLKAAKLSLGRRETMIADLKAKAANLQQQLQQDDRFELIDRAVNAEAKLKATASSAARKEAQIRSLQERLAEAGRAEARRAASEAEAEEKASARLRTELRRRETELRNMRQELAAAHEALEMAAQSAEAAAISESHQLRRADERAARQAKFAEDLIAAVRAVSRLALRASASMRSAAEAVGTAAEAAAAPWPASPFGEGEGELGAELSEIAGLVGAVGITPGEVQQLLGIDRSGGRRRGAGSAQAQRPAPQAQSLAKVSYALRQLEAALEGMAAEDDLENADPNRGARPPAAGWDAKPVSALLEGLEAELRHAEGELSAAAEAQRSAAGAAPARRLRERRVEVDRGAVGEVVAGLRPARRGGSSAEEEEELSFQYSSGGHSSTGSWAATAREMGHDLDAATRDARARLAQRNA
eukprot:jgi/Tetstr1/447418/TSEL_034852.t2